MYITINFSKIVFFHSQILLLYYVGLTDGTARITILIQLFMDTQNHAIYHVGIYFSLPPYA